MLFGITLITLIGFVSTQESIIKRKCDEFYPDRGSEFGQFSEVPRQGHVDAESNEFPYMVTVGFEDDDGNFKYGCAGVLIDPKYVLCPAFCMNPIHQEGKSTVVYVGKTDISNPKALSGGIEVNRTILHPEYKRPQIYNQIAIVELKTTALEPPVCLWNGKTDHIRHNVVAYDRETRKLYKTSASVVSNDECSDFLKVSQKKIPNGIPSSLFCLQEEDKINCQPSVGPAIAQRMEGTAKVPYVIGIPNVGLTCEDKPSLFSKTSEYVDWIASTIWQNA